MRINHNISAMVTQGSLFKTNRSMSKNMEKLSTGLRINSASDDAAGLGVSENLRTQVRGTNQAKQNSLDGISALQVAEGATNEISAILQRMRELAVQSSNDTLTETERAYTDAEFQQLTTEIDRIAEVTNYNGMDLLSTAADRFGETTDGSYLWIDANAVEGVDGITVSIDTMTADSNGLELTDDTLSTQEDSVNAITAIDQAIDSVNTLRSNLGSYINRLEHTINNLEVSNTNQQSAESTIRDTDFAEVSTQFTKNQILQQSATSMLSQANMTPQSALQLVGG
ncbi:MAG: flagellin [Chitinivibrionales bacterium]